MVCICLNSESPPAAGTQRRIDPEQTDREAGYAPPPVSFFGRENAYDETKHKVGLPCTGVGGVDGHDDGVLAGRRN